MISAEELLHVKLKYPAWSGCSIRTDLAIFRHLVPENVYMEIWQAVCSPNFRTVEEFECELYRILVMYERTL